MLLWSIALLIPSASAEEECALLQVRADLVRRGASKPWDHHMYLVGTRHKAGSDLLGNIMQLAFDELGATLSCQEWPHGYFCPTWGTEAHAWPHEHLCPHPAYINTTGGYQKCYLKPHIAIHWDNRLLNTSVERTRHIGAEISKPLRGVQIIRDPLQMVASAYCFHHGGHEPHNLVDAPANITQMGYETGVPAVAGTMLLAVSEMVAAYLASGTDVLVVRFEKLTRSSQDFDSGVAQLFDAMFGGLITDSEMTRIKEVAKQEDLHRGENGLSAGTGHVSDPEDKRCAVAALDLMEPGLLQQYHEFQRVLGYQVGH